MLESIVFQLENFSAIQYGALFVVFLALVLVVVAFYSSDDPQILEEEARKAARLDKQEQYTREIKLTKSVRKESEKLKQERTNQLMRSIENSKVIESKKGKNKEDLHELIQKSGLNYSLKQLRYIGLGVSVVICCAIYFTLGSLLSAILIALPVGFLLPKFIISRATNKRAVTFVKQFPEALEAIARGVMAGMPIKECLELIALEADDPIASEFRLILSRLSLGIPLKDSVRIIADRIVIPETNFFAIAIAIQQQTGGSISETMRNLAKVLRDRKALRDKIKSATMEAKMSACIIGALPIFVSVFINYLNPGYMEPLFATTMGNIIAIGAGIWMGIGVVIMAVLINFKI